MFPIAEKEVVFRKPVLMTTRQVSIKTGGYENLSDDKIGINKTVHSLGEFSYKELKRGRWHDMSIFFLLFLYVKNYFNQTKFKTRKRQKSFKRYKKDLDEWYTFNS